MLTAKTIYTKPCLLPEIPGKMSNRGGYRGRGGGGHHSGRGHRGGRGRGGGGGGGFDYTRFIQKRETNVVTEVNLSRDRCNAVHRALGELEKTSPQYFTTDNSGVQKVQVGNGLLFEENVSRAVKDKAETPNPETNDPETTSHVYPVPSPPKEMTLFREKLPAFQKRSEILSEVNRSQVLLITGETGCGKTTQVPQFLLENAMENNQRCRIVCTQPRRIAAISMAERVAQERGERLGSSVGFQIRLENKLPTNMKGNILFCTTGKGFLFY